MVENAVPARAAGRPRLGFFAICLAYCAIILDASVLNVAVPAIRSGLGSSMAGAQWVLDAYTLPLAALLLTAGALGDRLGLRRMLLGGIALFTLASAACAAAPDPGALIAARAVQGIGAAALLPATLAMIPHLFPAAAGQARAAVTWVAAGAVAVALGPLTGGALIGAFGWRSIFLINLPIGVISIALIAASVTETPRPAAVTGTSRPAAVGETPRRAAVTGTSRPATVTETSRRAAPLDHPGQVAAVAALGLLTAALILGGSAGWADPATLAALAGAIAAAAGFRWRERRAAHPLVPPSFLADRTRTVAIASAGLMGFAFYGTLFVTSLYFQQLRGQSPAAAGLALLPLTAGSAIGPLLLYRPLARRYGHPPLLLAGFTLCAAGTATLGWLGPHTSYAVAAAGLLLTGAASTIAFSALTSLLMASVPPAQSGLGSGLQNTTRQSGALIAVSILGSVLSPGLGGGRLAAAFVIIGIAALAGITAGLLALRAATRAEPVPA
ncbi:MAG: MFS transporter [Actinobacteria bacterium]|nr:MFS transporter [Actinomycetota bacterium]